MRRRPSSVHWPTTGEAATKWHMWGAAVWQARRRGREEEDSVTSLHLPDRCRFLAGSTPPPSPFAAFLAGLTRARCPRSL
jgi:hypothetical protein